jgi:glycosidase
MQLGYGVVLMLALAIVFTTTWCKPWLSLVVLGMVVTVLLIVLMVVPADPAEADDETLLAPRAAAAAAATTKPQNLLYEEEYIEGVPTQTQLLNTVLTYGGDFSALSQPRLKYGNRQAQRDEEKIARVESMRQSLLQRNPTIFKGEHYGQYLFLDHQEEDYDAAQRMTNRDQDEGARFMLAAAPSTLGLIHVQRAIDTDIATKNYANLGSYQAWAAATPKPMVLPILPHHKRHGDRPRATPQTTGDYAYPALPKAHAAVFMPPQANSRYAHGHVGLFPNGFIRK